MDGEPIRYILDENKRPVRARLLEWTIWMEREENRIVGFDVVDSAEVVTAFLGFERHRPPDATSGLYLWETRWDGTQIAWHTSHESALRFHWKTVNKQRFHTRSDFPN